jgi:nucleotide-binding universal stress UspA family protein
MKEKTKILVPLDGSEVAEDALGEALILAKALNAEVTLLHVIPIPEDVIGEGATSISIDERWQARRDRTLQYLNAIRNRPEWSGVATQVAVESGNPAGTILDYCQRHDIDRIVMSTHGRNRSKLWVLGSVAYKVVHAGDRTIVLVRSRSNNVRSR